MITNQSELTGTLQKLASAADYLSALKSESMNPAVEGGSMLAVVRDQLKEIYAYFGINRISADVRIELDDKPSSHLNASVNIIGSLLSDWQGLIWDSGEKVIGHSPRVSGRPTSRVSDNCSFMLAFAGFEQGGVGLNFIRGDMLFPDYELRENAFQLVSELVYAVNAEETASWQALALEPVFLSRVRSMGRGAAANFGEVRFVDEVNGRDLIQLTPQTPVHANRMLQRFARPVEKTIEGHLMVLNFFTRQITIAGQERIRMFYDPDQISDERIADAAFKYVRIKGTEFISATGSAIDFIPAEVEVIDG